MATIAPVFAILGASLFNKNTFYSTTITGNSLVYLKKRLSFKNALVTK